MIPGGSRSDAGAGGPAPAPRVAPLWRATPTRGVPRMAPDLNAMETVERKVGDAPSPCATSGLCCRRSPPGAPGAARRGVLVLGRGRSGTSPTPPGLRRHFPLLSGGGGAKRRAAARPSGSERQGGPGAALLSRVPQPNALRMASGPSAARDPALVARASGKPLLPDCRRAPGPLVGVPGPNSRSSAALWFPVGSMPCVAALPARLAGLGRSAPTRTPATGGFAGATPRHRPASRQARSIGERLQSVKQQKHFQVLALSAISAGATLLRRGKYSAAAALTSAMHHGMAHGAGVQYLGAAVAPQSANQP